MASLRHEIPTHLNVEDRALFGLSVRQLALLLAGCAAAYAAYDAQEGELADREEIGRAHV